MFNFNTKRCIICKQETVATNKLFCDRHIGNYVYNYSQDFIHIKLSAIISKIQRKLYVVVRDLYREPTFQEVIFDWAAKPEGSYFRYDIVVPSKKLICEMDGQQHFKFNKMMHGTRAVFKEAKADDKIKEELAKKNGFELIRFSFKTKLTKTNIENIINSKLKG